MKDMILRYRFTLASFVILAFYVLVNCDWLVKHFKAEDMLAYFSGLAAVILLSSLFIKDRSLRARLSWAVLVPEVGSLVGYGLLTVFFWQAHVGGNSRGISFTEWVAVAAITPLFVARVSTISLMLMLFCGIDHYASRRSNGTATLVG
jgi:hypothetical protein